MPVTLSDPEFLPVSGFDLPRFAGPATFMRLADASTRPEILEKTQLGILGIPWDGGTTNRPGARHGPRQVRDLSTMIRPVHPVSRLNPFATLNCADVGDIPPNPADILDTLERIENGVSGLLARGMSLASVGGDHLSSLPVLRALVGDRKRRGIEKPLAMIHFDAHTDLFEGYFGGQKYTHGTPFRRAIEEGILDPKHVVQIGIRGTMYDGEDIEWGRAHGVTIIEIDAVRTRGHEDIMAEARSIVGDRDTYVSFDIDVIDPAFAPGTGTPEIGGIDTWTAQQLVRGLEGVKVTGADLVEVAPPFDASGGTAWVAASILFEIVCVLVEAQTAS